MVGIKKRSIIVLILGFLLALLIAIVCTKNTLKYRNIQKTYVREQAMVISDDGWDSRIKYDDDDSDGIEDYDSDFELYITQKVKIQYCDTEFTKDIEEEIYRKSFSYKPDKDTIYSLYEENRYKNGDTFAVYYNKDDPSDCYSQIRIDKDAGTEWMTGVSMGLPIIIFSLVLAKILNGRRKKSHK